MTRFADYQSLIAAIEHAGRFTSFRPKANYVACVSDRDEKGTLLGCSFLVSRKNGRWHIRTWGGDECYLVPSDKDLLKLCLELLGHAKTPPHSIPEQFVRDYELELVPSSDAF